jgi:hypothetical protein
MMNRIFHCTLPHKDQLERWQQWDQAKQRAILDHLRTGTFGPATQDGIGNQTLPELTAQSGVGGLLGRAVPDADTINWGQSTSRSSRSPPSMTSRILSSNIPLYGPCTRLGN